MFTLTEIRPPVTVPDAEYLRLLGYPKNRPLEGRARELADEAQKWFAENGRPWIRAQECSSLEWDGEKLRLAGMEISSRRFREALSTSKAHSVVLLTVSAGKECEEHAKKLWDEEKPDEYYFLESYGSAVVEQLVTLANGRICGWADANQMAALPHFSPGYAGWNVTAQVPLWELFRREFAGGLPGELEVLESGMLRPKKSQLAVVGLTRDLEKAGRLQSLIPCEQCPMSSCQYRRAPFKRYRPRLEEPDCEET
ncbi:MAG TPA: hypothetical protein VNU95_02320 [Candidatus Acidoferrales bacterium]|jgi:hypothetical protein|nr:hypothetical protein [Candidatus Acidoferrales bacterium]